ncbi:MAG: hypothetical protein KF754_16465, partial [Planctomycetes bacterium]|nr:hypothetical protein [Planctomycetota bacterium]
HVSIITHTKTSAPADRPELEIFWGDGTSDTLPRTQIINIPGSDAQQNLYEGSHLFSGPGVYILSMEDPNRNEGVLNIINSVNVPFCVKTMLVISPLTGGNCSVRFLNSPLQDACRQSLWVHNPGAFDSDGDSLSYELIPCSGAGCATIPGYLYPDQVPAPANTFSMDPLTGTITWNTPQLIGEYNIAFRVREWRRLGNGNYQEVGWVTRDMQITVKPCNNQTPVIADLPDTCVVAGTFLAFNVAASDPDPTQSITLTSLGGPYQVPNSPASFLSPPPANTVNGVFSWNTNCSHVRLAPWQVVFRAQDNGVPVPLENYETVNIRIVSPPPLNPTVVPQANSLLLNWEPGICGNMTGYRLYRRVGAYGFTPAHCETGVPAYTGYQFLAAVNGAANTTYTDNAVLFGVEYCYMVTAVFADGAESLASVEFCAFLDRSVPLITHASVGITDISAGQDTVRWTNAIDLDTLTRPGPYQFRLYRGDGFTGANTLIHTSTLHPFLLHPDTAFIDIGLDTRTGPHVYRVELFGDGGTTLIGSSDPASTVLLSATPNDQLVALTWAANTP